MKLRDVMTAPAISIGPDTPFPMWPSDGGLLEAVVARVPGLIAVDNRVPGPRARISARRPGRSSLAVAAR